MAAPPLSLNLNTKSASEASNAAYVNPNFSGFTVNYGNGNTGGAASAVPWWVWPAVAVVALVIFKRKGR